MLENLVESRNSNEQKSRSGYLLTTFTLVTALAFSGVLWSLFAKDVAMGSDDFALSKLVTPLPIPAEAPPPAPKEPKQLPTTAPTAVNQTTRQTNMLRVDENPIVPKTVSTVPNSQKARPEGKFLLRNGAETNFQSTANAVNDDRGKGGSSGDDIGNSGQENNRNITPTATPPPPPLPPAIKKPAPEPAKTLVTILKSNVINGKASSLPKPNYPAAAQTMHVEGDVNVQVLIDEAGNVVSAKAVSGHPLLRSVSEVAARNAKFSPTILNGQKVKVSGIIVYKFTR